MLDMVEVPWAAVNWPLKSESSASITNKAVNVVLAGEYASVCEGQGMEFEVVE
jgi:hypothetical protein